MTIPFTLTLKQAALTRQKNRCASCGTKVHALGLSGAAAHPFGESSEAHHAFPHKLGGPNTPENCVIICRACHLNAHQGGAWQDVSIYRNLAGPMSERVAQAAKFFKFYRGSDRASELGRHVRSVLGIDEAWTATQPSGVALVVDDGKSWRLARAASSYVGFAVVSDHTARRFGRPAVVLTRMRERVRGLCFSGRG